jgi:CheY-like chemotaxis protein
MNAPPLVLYAEDDENDAFFMQRAFAKLRLPDALQILPTGKQVVEYLSGTGDFADRARHPMPTLLILDVKMPEMSGLEALAWVRAREEFSGLPIVMFSSSTQATDIAYCSEHDANAYLVKPANANQLVSLVSELLAAAAVGGQVLRVTGNRIQAGS